MGEITNDHAGEFFQAFGIDVSGNSSKLSLGFFRNNAEGVNPDVMIDYPLLIDGNSAFGTSAADRDKYFVLSHEGIIVHILEGNKGNYIGDEPMQELEDAIALAISNAAAASGPGDLVINFSGLEGPHLGQMLELRVVDKSTNMSIVDTSLAEIPATGFSFTFAGIMEPGKDYDVDFYVDANENGTYDAPGADHAWRETLTTVSGNQTIDFTHNTSFTDIEYPVVKVKTQYSSTEISLGFYQDEVRVNFPENSQAIARVAVFKAFNVKGTLLWESENQIHQNRVSLQSLPQGTVLLQILFQGQKYLKTVPLRVE